MTGDATTSALIVLRLAPLLKRQDELERRIESLERKIVEKKEPEKSDA